MRKLLVLFTLLISFNFGFAHEVRPAFLQIEQTSDSTFHVLWKIPAKGTAVPKDLFAVTGKLGKEQ